jgi:hypothetical protein
MKCGPRFTFLVSKLEAVWDKSFLMEMHFLDEHFGCRTARDTLDGNFPEILTPNYPMGLGY